MAAAAANRQYLFVAAIDFGTTYSGYAFSSKDDFKKDPLKITANVWNSGNILSHKAPTALLLNPNKSFHSFGYNAESDYARMAEEEDKDLHKYYYFHRFKMLLHNNKNLTRRTTIKDEMGKPLPAFEVFVHSIRYLKNHVYGVLKDGYTDLVDTDIKYVLTVPAIWDDIAKQFMREAADKAGIKGSQLMIALEPESASIFCQALPTDIEGSESFMDAAKSGSTYMVVDLGGGTADITVHQRQGDRSLKELLPATGGAYGGKSVDDEFWTFLGKIVGEENLTKLKKNNMDDYIDISRQFEIKKREIKVDPNKKVVFNLPATLLEILKHDKKRKNMTEAVSQSPFGDSVRYERYRLFVSNEQFRELFEKTIRGILQHIEKILYERKFQHVEHILMVGGFSECELVQTAIRKRLTKKKIIVPNEAGMAVLNGAVLFGHTPKAISCRVARYTYGMQTWPDFDPNRHPQSKRVVVEGIPRCKDVFFKFIEAGEEVTPGHRESQVFQAINPNELTLECSVYATPEKDPQYVDDDGCILLGVLTVPLNPARAKPVQVEESLIFGETELHVQAKDRQTGQIFETQFNLLQEGI